MGPLPVIKCYKWSNNPDTWPYKWETELITILIGLMAEIRRSPVVVGS